MKNTPRRVSTLLAAMALALPLGQAFAADPAPPSAAPSARVPADARAVMDRMGAYLGSLESFSVSAQTSRDQLVDEGYKLQNNEAVTMHVRRPDRMRVEVDGDMGGRTFVYDGDTLVMHSALDQAWVRAKAPATLNVLLGNMLAAGIEMPLVDVVYQAVSGTLLYGVRGGVLVGTSTIDGVACDQVAFRQGNVDWQVWVEKGARALPRKIVITTRHEYGQPQFEAVLDWNVSPKFNAATFRFDPPAGSTQLPFESPVPLDQQAPAGGAR